MPRRKYGRLQHSFSANDPHKCRICKLGKPCPAHPHGIPERFVAGKKFKKREMTKEEFLKKMQGGGAKEVSKSEATKDAKQHAEEAKK